MNRIQFQNEFERYLSLHRTLYEATALWVATTPDDKLDWAPIDNPNVRFGTRVQVVTIRNLAVHVAIEEYVWLQFLKDCEDEAEVPLPKRLDLTQQLTNGDLATEVAQLHNESEKVLLTMSDQDLAKKIRFADRTWTVMEFLWAMYAHRAYHLGNINIYLRQSDTPAPNFFRFKAEVTA